FLRFDRHEPLCRNAAWKSAAVVDGEDGAVRFGDPAPMGLDFPDHAEKGGTPRRLRETYPGEIQLGLPEHDAERTHRSGIRRVSSASFDDGHGTSAICSSSCL